MDGAALVAWARAFALTEIVEAPIYRYALPTTWPRALAASAITHPVVWFVFPWIAVELDLGWTTMAVLAETFAVAVEAAFFARAGVRARRAALVSLLANGASVTVGLFVRARWGLV